MQHLNIIEKFLYDNSIESIDSLERYISSIGTSHFFNKLTDLFYSGKKFKKHEHGNQVKSAAFMYFPDCLKDKIANGVSSIAFNSFYLQAMTSNFFKYNYNDYGQLLKDLYIARKEAKRKNKDIVQFTIKYYLNLVYGSVNNPNTNLTESHDSYHFEISVINANILKRLARFLIENGVTIYKIETDELFTSELSSEFQKSINEYILKDLNYSINENPVNFDFFSNVGFVDKKRYFAVQNGAKFITHGFRPISHEEVSRHNKEFLI